MKRLVTLGVAAVMVAIGAGSAVAAGGPPVIETVPADFVLTSGTCPNLPAGTTITGTGSGKSITRVSVDKTGLVRGFRLPVGGQLGELRAQPEPFAA